jgi:hypothetical protein
LKKDLAISPQGLAGADSGIGIPVYEYFLPMSFIVKTGSHS